MRYRALDANGDFQFGRSGIFLVNSPEAVAQAIRTRLALWAGEWFLDNEEGTDYSGKILGYGTQGTRDVEVKSRILNTQGVREIVSYSSSVDPARKFTVTAVVDTDYGQATINL